MTSLLLDKALGAILPKILISKEGFDTLAATENKKPGTAIPGLKAIDSTHEPLDEDLKSSFILADVPNFHKEKGTSMSQDNFIMLPRSLLESEGWLRLRLRQQKLFIFLLDKAQYSYSTVRHKGVDIHLTPGQICIPLRTLVSQFNDNIKFKDEMIDLSFLQRSIATFSRIGLIKTATDTQTDTQNETATNTQTDTPTTIITIMCRGVFDKKKTSNETATDTQTDTQNETATDTPYGTRGFVKFPRSLLSDARWRSLKIKYQKIFITLLIHVSYSQKKYSANFCLIDINPGQICISLRRLMRLCNEGVRFKADKVDKNIIERGVSVLTDFQFAIHEILPKPIHQLSIFSVVYKGIFSDYNDKLETPINTQNETKPRLNRDTNEERKKERYKKETIDSNEASAFDSFLFQKIEEKKKKPNEAKISSPSVFDLPTSPKPTGLTAEKEAHRKLLWEIAVKHGLTDGHTANGKPGVKDTDLTTWLKKYEANDISDAMLIVSGKDIRRSFAAYIEKLLGDKIPQKESDLIKGKEQVKEFVRMHEMKHIDLKQDYFVDTVTTEQVYYSLPEHTLLDILERSRERVKCKKEEEDRHESCDDQYY